MNSTLSIAWTTVSSQQDAYSLAHAIIEQKLAACIQVEGPLQSFYRWNEKIENEEEYRLLIKAPSWKLNELEAWIHENHPYETPQWITIEANTSKAYQLWAEKSCK